MYFVYILFSDKTLKYYTGQTDSIDKRLFRHNAGLSLSTKTGIPWKLVYKIGFTTRSEAMVLELKIKKEEQNDILMILNI